MNDLIQQYKDGKSIETLCRDYKIGKLKVKKILIANGIQIRKKGGVVKNNPSEKKNLDEFSIECKACQKTFSTVENKNGTIIQHIQSCNPNVEIISSFKRRMYLQTHGEPWHLQFFNLIPKIREEYLECKMCNWKTKDIKNIGGSLTKHIKANHSSVTEYIENHPTEAHLFSTYTKFKERDELFNDSDNYVTCKICDEKFKTISNTHLMLHDLNVDEYAKIYGQESLVSKNKKLEFIENLKNSDFTPKYRSNEEIEIEEFIKSLDVQYVTCDKKTLNGVELDIFLPTHKIAIEYNGLYWHSEKQGKTKNYHLDKTDLCLKNNIRLIHIFSDEWKSRKEIIKNRILNLLGKNNQKIYARKCQIVVPTKKEKSEFLNKNHLQGNDKSSIYIGLKYNERLVALITFGKLRKVMGNKKIEENVYELYRYCNNNVVGGFSKLMKHFLVNYAPNKIITYSDRNWTPSDQHCFYGNMGFEYCGLTKPNYYYTKKYTKREHRYNFRKNKLVEMGFDKDKSESQIMFELGYDKIWDTGNLKYEYTKKGE